MDAEQPYVHCRLELAQEVATREVEREAFLTSSVQKARLGVRAGKAKELSPVPVTAESLHDPEQILDHLFIQSSPNHTY